MYESYFGLREMPFSVIPDPRFFYTNDLYKGTFGALRYGVIWKKALILLTGEVGTGKTTFLRKLMRELEAKVQTIHVFYTYLSFDELVQLILQDAGLTGKGKSRLEMFHEFKEHLVRQFNNGRTVALLIDEAQNLTDESLEGLRLLSNLEENNEKLLQIVLVGQPELHEKLDKPSMRQLKDRVAIRCHLDSLSHREIGDYIRHRLRVAGYDGPEIFSNEAVERIGTYSRGKPRLINTLCDNALMLAYGASSKKVSADMVVDAASDLGLEANIQIAKVKVRGMEQRSQGASNDNGDSNDNGEKGIKKGEHRVEGLPPARPVVDSPRHTVPPEFFYTMTRALAEAMGPMASVVITDQISALGESDNAFPIAKLGQLVDLVSRSILNQAMKADFQDFISKEIYRDNRLSSEWTNIVD